MDYQKIIDDYPYLPRETEQKLFEIYKNGNEGKETAFQILFLSNIRNIHYIVINFINKYPKWRYLYMIYFKKA